MENWSNSTHRASLKPKTQYTPPEPKQYTEKWGQDININFRTRTY